MAVNASAHELYEPVAHALFEMAQESTVEAVGLWRKGGMATIDELDGDIQRRIARAFESNALGERLEGELHAWLDELMPDAGGRTDVALRPLRRSAGEDEPDGSAASGGCGRR